MIDQSKSGEKATNHPGLAPKKDKGKRIKKETGKQFICMTRI
jgi:hypothetical protein